MDDPSDETTCRILRTRNALLQKHSYIADPDFLQYVEWQRRGRKNLLYPVASAENDDCDDVASLSVIAFIPDDGFWLTSDAGWKGPTKITPTLSEAKATCVATFPRDNSVLRNDFQVALDHVHTLQDKVATPNAEDRRGFSQPGSTKFKFRHVLFEVQFLILLASHHLFTNKKPTDDNDLEGTVPLTQWPVHNNTAREALQLMGSTFRAIPIPAYDTDDQLIRPALYRQKLSGALAEIGFHLSHIFMGDKDAYTADIHTLRVLQAPLPQPTIPKKKLPQTFLETRF